MQQTPTKSLPRPAAPAFFRPADGSFPRQPRAGLYQGQTERKNHDIEHPCLYLVTRSLDPTGTGRTRWTMRWKAPLNAFTTTFEGRIIPSNTN